MSNVLTKNVTGIPGENLDMHRMPGHWALARMGKRVLRPGGLELTRRMLRALNINSRDDVIEFAPGIGTTARLTLSLNPASYIAVERDQAAAELVKRYLNAPTQRSGTGNAAETGLSNESATVVYGEAMLTMQTPEMKQRIVREAARVLKSGGRYGIHELCLTPDDLSDARKQEIQAALSRAIHVGARPLTRAEWHTLLEAEGFQIRFEGIAPMSLLEPKRLFQDEGAAGALRFAWNVLNNREARGRVREMRATFRRYRANLLAVTMVAVKS